MEEVVTRLAGRKITVGGVEGPGPAPGKAAAAALAPPVTPMARRNRR